MFSFKYTPRNFVKNFPLIGALSVCNGGEIFGKTFLFLKEQNKQYFFFGNIQGNVIGFKPSCSFS